MTILSRSKFQPEGLLNVFMCQKEKSKICSALAKARISVAAYNLVSK